MVRDGGTEKFAISRSSVCRGCAARISSVLHLALAVDVASRGIGAIEMESYVVRIYRRNVDGGVAGMVEDALSRRKKVFRSIDELSDWLRRRPRAARRSTSDGVLDTDAQ
jgi:hypothetical protein